MLELSDTRRKIILKFCVHEMILPKGGKPGKVRYPLEYWHTYSSTPKMRAHCERFNRTIQEEFVDYHEHLLFTNLQKFNEKLADWLVWYNKK